MQRFLSLAPETRRQAMEQVAAAKGLAFVAVEKDFWVCWTLEQLFRLPEIGAHLTFKGGTSLSKVWGLIERFSEDIDLVIEKAWLGFSGKLDPELAPSVNQRKERIKELKSACVHAIQDPIQAALKASIQSNLPPGLTWSLSLDPEDPEGQTLLFNYPCLASAGSGYLYPRVKIELGARSDIEPAEPGEATAEVAKAFPRLFDEAAVPLRALRPERTFLEKVTLLHEEVFRPSGKPRPQKLARHYYDVARLIQQDVGTRAVNAPGLFERVVAHRRAYFRQTWVNYDTMARGTLNLVPAADKMGAWAKDYAAMREEMFLGNPPSWEDIIRVVAEWERGFNQP